MASQAAKLRILETIDILQYTFKGKAKGASIDLNKKFLIKLRSEVIGTSTSFISRNWMAEIPVLKFSKIYDLAFPTTFFALKNILPNVLSWCNI
jgi:hypothetical protein